MSSLNTEHRMYLYLYFCYLQIMEEFFKTHLQILCFSYFKGKGAVFAEFLLSCT